MGTVESHCLNWSPATFHPSPTKWDTGFFTKAAGPDQAKEHVSEASSLASLVSRVGQNYFLMLGRKLGYEYSFQKGPIPAVPGGSSSMGESVVTEKDNTGWSAVVVGLVSYCGGTAWGRMGQRRLRKKKVI